MGQLKHRDRVAQRNTFSNSSTGYVFLPVSLTPWLYTPLIMYYLILKKINYIF